MKNIARIRRFTDSPELSLPYGAIQTERTSIVAQGKQVESPVRVNCRS
jgi:hypothetical protein